MYKRVLILFIYFVINVCMADAATQVKVVSIQDFNTLEPTETFHAKILEPVNLGGYNLDVNTVLHCQIFNIIEPKRGKRDASFYVIPTYYSTESGMVKRFEEEMYGKYAKHVLSKEELKKIPSFKTLKKAGLAVGNLFVKGLSTGCAFVEGAWKNENDNRLKSGVVHAYEESPLSLIIEGDQLEIKVGDEFYFVFRTKND